MRSALIDYFHDEAEIMIATEAAAEGVNLQFCSLVITMIYHGTHNALNRESADVTDMAKNTM